MAEGFRLTSKLYIANDKAPNKTQTSPIPNLKANKVCKLPFDISTMIPARQNSKPANRSAFIFSLKSNSEMIITNTGEDVVPIKAILMAEVDLPAMYTSVLKMDTPVSATKSM